MDSGRHAIVRPYERLPLQNWFRHDEAPSSRRQFLARCGMGVRRARSGQPALRGSARRRSTRGGQSQSRRISRPRPSTSSTSSPQGAPSHVDTWDPKPALTKLNGQTLPGLNGVAMASPFKFAKYGKSGIEVSEVFSAIAKHVDDLAVIRSMQTDIPAHDVAHGVHEHRLAAHRSSRASARGCSTDSAARTRTCPASSRCGPTADAAGRRAELGLGVSAGRPAGDEHQHVDAHGRGDDPEHPQRVFQPRRSSGASSIWCRS